MKDGAPKVATDGTGLRVALVAASWHEQVSTPKPIGTRVRTATSVMPTVAAWHT